ncbi:helix-turn-helix transcriptional regulator (plasmid) [Clostridium estertheticum]|uniref:helix-turn-helix domain-containing protein n=1 Tax=Clostridium estertheticum TaxID=238834 RepID=UPI001C7DAA41|nr:helix-turn-helix transcriptional regulator [Clostridium estertheticum]MBX4262778.1 helix-turn-helix transcriptional regulator [Clostridium estertheticum]WLC72813.1 helix-turn-helix transcriptional regulator [Clostridium estertheticum]
MGFHKVNPNDEIKKAIVNNGELETYINEADAQYQLIKMLVEFRKNIGLTQNEVSQKSGLTQQMISRIEKLDNSPTLDNFIKYVMALGLKLKVDKVKDERLLSV